MSEIEEEMSRALTKACEGLTSLEAALLVAAAARDVFGKQYTIEMHPNGSFTIKRVQE